jgi:pilus assembly protein CpaF
MRLAIRQAGKEDDVHALTANVIHLGDGEAAGQVAGNAIFIALPKGAAVGLQFELRKRRDAYRLVNRGGVTATFKRSRFRENQEHVVAEGDELALPFASVTFIPDAVVKPTAGAAQARKATGNEWQELQESIHERLRDEFELDQAHKVADLSEPEVQDKIKSRLRALINADLGALKEIDPLDQLVRQSALRRALRFIDPSEESGTDGGNGDDDRSMPEVVTERKLANFVGHVVDRMGGKGAPADGAKDLSLVDFLSAVDAQIFRLSNLDKQDIARMTLYENIRDLIFGLGPISDLLDFDAVTEIMVARYDQIYFERGGEIAQYPYYFTSDEQLVTIIRRMLRNEGRSFNRTSAMVDFRYGGGHRVNAIGDPLAVKGAALTIRKFPTKGRRRPTLVEISKMGTMSLSVAAFLRRAVLARKNIVISGGTGTGKTTMLNALGRLIPERERVVTIEDTAEMDFGEGHVVSLQARPATVESRNEVTIRDLVRNALRMRPDRIVIGECRGPEALDMLQAMNTGHAGSMTTAHANSSKDMMLRLETMVLQAGERLPVSAVRQQICSAIDVLVQLNRMAKGRRVLTEVAEIVGVDPQSGEVIVEAIYRHIEDVDDPDRSRSFFTGYLPSFTQELLEIPPEEGPDPPALFA